MYFNKFDIFMKSELFLLSKVEKLKEYLDLKV